MSCSIRISVIDGSSWRSRSVSATRSPRESPEAGSSSIIRRGFDARAIATSSWRCSPCESEPTRVCIRSARPTRRASSSVALAQRVVALAQDDRAEVSALRPEQREVQVVLDRQAEERPRLLVGAAHAELRAGARRQRRDLVAEELDRAGGRRHVTGDDVEQRRLPGAVRAENGAPLAVRDVEIDVTHGVEAAVAPADPPQAEDRLGVFGDWPLGQTTTR